MGLQKNKPATPLEAATESTHTANVESGAEAAIKRLKTSSAEPKPNRPYEDPSARGKTRCAQFEAALQSQAIAGMVFRDMKEYLALVEEAADAGVAYTFQEEQ